VSGWKEWQLAEVVEFNEFQTFLQDQVVQVYDDATDRTNTLGTAVAEGMVSYLKDTNAVEVYDLTGWVPLATGDITSVTAGTGLTGGGETGDVTLNVNYAAVGSAITIDGSQVENLEATDIGDFTSGTAGQYLQSNGTAGVVWVDLEVPDTAIPAFLLMGA